MPSNVKNKTKLLTNLEYLNYCEEGRDHGLSIDGLCNRLKLRYFLWCNVSNERKDVSKSFLFKDRDLSGIPGCQTNLAQWN